MSYYRFTPLILACVLSCAAGPVCAQDAAQATVAEGMGQGIGEAASGGQSIFVTATGREDFPAPAATWSAIIEGRSATAVDADKAREDRLAEARTLGQKFGVTVEVATESFSREADAGAQLAHLNEARDQAARAARKGSTVVMTGIRRDDCAVDCVFLARTSVRFKASDRAEIPAFLDALAAAGILVDTAEIASRASGPETVDDVVWDRLSEKAVASALHQAQALARAAGREVGDAEQIMVLSKSVQGGHASLTISVRYLLK